MPENRTNREEHIDADGNMPAPVYNTAKMVREFKASTNDSGWFQHGDLADCDRMHWRLVDSISASISTSAVGKMSGAQVV